MLRKNYGNGVGVDEEANRIYQTQIARLQAQQAFARGDTDEGWRIIRESEGALHALDQNGSAVPDPNEPTVTVEATVNSPLDDNIPGNENVGIEVIIWQGHGLTPLTQNGHVSYVIDGMSYSWQMYKDGSGNQVYYKREKDDYIEERSKSSAGTGYILDFGSAEKNQKFKEAIISSYDNGKGYNLVTNNCGQAFQNAINAIAGGGIPTNNKIHPYSQRDFITSSLKAYVVQPPNEYKYTGSWWRRGII